MIEVAVLNQLSDDTAVAALVGSRLYQLVVDQEPIYPCGRVQLIGEVESYVLAGDLTNFFQARVQIDVWDAQENANDPYTTARALGQAINDAMAGQTFSRDGVTVSSIKLVDRAVDYEADEVRLVRVRQDYAVVFQVTD